MKSITLAILTIASASLSAEPITEPRDLVDLRASFEKARSAAVAPLEKKYGDALTIMKERLTKNGDLSGALAVQAELTKLRAPTAPVDDAKLRLSKLKTIPEFIAWLSTTAWRNADGIFRFPEAGVVELTKDNGVLVKYSSKIEKVGTISWTYGSGAAEQMVIDSDLKTATTKAAGEIVRVDQQ